MPLDIALAGLSWPWMLDGERELDGWLRASPWLGQGATLAVATPSDPTHCIALLRRSVHQWDAGRSDVRIIELNIENDVSASVTNWLGVATANRRVLATKLGEDLECRPAVFVILTPSALATRAADDAEDLREWVAKLGHERGPLFFLLHDGPPLARGSMRADRGWPVGIADRVVTSPKTEAWRHYLHLRIAWEVGGDIDNAAACNDRLGEIRLGDDATCESTLNEFARQRFRALDRERQHELRAVYGTDLGPREQLGQRQVPAPWIARALLLEGVTTAARRALRAELICRPLVERLLNACFELEASLRMCIGDRSDACEDAQARAAHERYTNQTVHSLERDLYPPEHPAPPRDVWDFVSLGTLLYVIGERAPELLVLRNSLSHGHYVNWHAVSLLRSALARFT